MNLFCFICVATLGYIGDSSSVQTPIEMYATGGRAVFQSGPNHYTVVTTGSNRRDAAIVCSSMTLISELYLFKDESAIKMKTSTRGIQLHLPINDTFPGRYTCVGKFSTMTKNGIFINLTISTDIFITFTLLSVPSCGTSFGSSVFKDELIKMYCFGGHVSWQGQPGINLETVLIESADLSAYKCEGITPNGRQMVNCELPVSVSMDQISITISPTHFFSNESDMEFVCHSSPYRLVYWGVYGMKGNLLDWNNVEFSFPASTNITINQTESGSRLRISESAIQSNSIHTVSCYTYDTIKRSAFATNIHDSSDNVTEMDTLQTDSVSPPPALFTIRGVAEESNITPSSTSYTVFTIQGAGAITLVVLLCLLMFCFGVIVSFLILRNPKSKANEQPEVPDDSNTKVDHDDENPQLYPNPAYQSFNPNTGDTSEQTTNDYYDYAYVDQKTSAN